MMLKSSMYDNITNHKTKENNMLVELTQAEADLIGYGMTALFVTGLLKPNEQTLAFQIIGKMATALNNDDAKFDARHDSQREDTEQGEDDTDFFEAAFQTIFAGQSDFSLEDAIKAILDVPGSPLD
jgi:hypothetical protein